MFWTKVKSLTAAMFLAAVTLGIGTGALLALTANEQPQNNGNLSFISTGQGEGENRPNVSGVLKGIDLEQGTITVITSKDGEGRQEKVYSLKSKDIEVKLERENGKLSDLRPNTKVGLFVSDAGDVTAIQAQTPTSRAVITSIDADKLTVSFRATEENPAKTLKIARDAKIFVGERPITLADVPANRLATVTMSLDQSIIVRLQVAPGEGEVAKRPGDGDGQRPTIGELVSFDKDKSEITIFQRKDAGAVEQTLPVSKDVKVFAGERPIQIADLEKGTRIALKLSADGKTVETIRLEAKGGGGKQTRVGGTVKSVDAEKNTITITIPQEGGGGRDKTLTVAKDYRLTGVGKERATLADIPAGSRILATVSPERDLVVEIRIFGAGGDKDREEE